MRAMETGSLVRVEELTRIPADVQDALITILSEKTLPVPELDDEVQAVQGFNIIATANNRDKGVNDLSSALQAPLQHRGAAAAGHARAGGRDRPHPRRRARRALQLPADLSSSVRDRAGGHGLPRAARRASPRTSAPRIKSPSATLSTAEAISVMTNGLALAAHFGDGRSGPTTWPPAWSAPWSRTPSRTVSSGRSTSRPSSGTGRSGRTCTGPAASSD